MFSKAEFQQSSILVCLLFRIQAHQQQFESAIRYYIEQHQGHDVISTR